MKRNEVENQVKKIVSDVTGISVTKLDCNASFMDEYNLDSLRALEILAAVENQYDIMIDPDFLTEMTSIEKVTEITFNALENIGKI